MCKDEASRIAARREAALAQPDNPKCRTRSCSRFDTHAPRRAVLPRMSHNDIAAEIDHAAHFTHLFFDESSCGSHRVLLADPTEIDLHLRLHLQLGTAPSDLVPPNVLTQLVDRCWRRNTITTVKGPRSPQHA